MINLEEIVKKVDTILNGVDTEIPSGLVSPENDNYFFNVYSEGIYLSKLNDMKTGKNFLPVIVGAYGGENNPILGLGEQDRNVMIQILFPVRFKQEMYALEEYLDEIFVGRELIFGSQKAVCNVSPAQFSELQDFNLDEFKMWVENTYLKPVQVSEVYMAMSINLYISTEKNVGADGGFTFGNCYKLTLKVGTLANGTSGTFTATLTDETPVFTEVPNVSSIEPSSQQILGETHAKGLGAASAFSKQLDVYVKNTSGYIWLLQKYLDKDLQGLVVQITEEFDFGKGNSNPKKTSLYALNDLNVTPAKGELLTIAFDLYDLLEVE